MINRSKLTKLSEDCARLLLCSEMLEANNTREMMNNNRVIRQALRKIIIANEIADRMIICITGLQGTGKTTLVKNYYEIDETIMNISTGRGERLPILITESDVENTELYAMGIEKTDNSYSAIRRRVQKEEFIEFSQAEDDDTTIMFLEILVPWKYLSKGTKVSYMLLPGYERKNSYWNTLIEFSVQCSDTAVFVLSPDKLADANNASLIEKIKKQFGENVIYAISHSDEKNDDNASIRESLIKKVNADDEDGSRFVCVGTYTDPQKNDAWKKKLQDAIELNCANSQEADQKNTKYIEDIIANELRPAVIKIKQFVTDVTDELLTGFKQSSWIAAFDKCKDKYRNKFEKQLNEHFSKAQSQDRDDLLNIMEYGEKAAQDGRKDPNISLKAVMAKVQYYRRSVFGEGFEDIRKSREIIEEAMKGADGKYRYQQAFSDAITCCTDQICICDENVEERTKRIGESSGRKTLIGSKKTEEKKRILQDITTILSPIDATEKKELEANPLDTIQAIVECATQYYGLVMVEGLYTEGFIKDTKLSQSELSLEDIAASIKESEKFAMSVLGITGLDLIGDGVLNFIPSLAQSLSISVPFAGAIVSGFVGAGAFISLMKDCNKLQLKDYYSYNKTISSIYDDVKKKYLEIYDDYMDDVRDRVEKYLVDCMGANVNAIHRQNAIISIKSISDDLESIRRELKGNSYEPTKLIRG